MKSGSMEASGSSRAEASRPSRAEASRPRPLCRNFARGSCRWGQSCRFSHDRRSAQVCRYFQRGVCRYGERCNYHHIQEEPAPGGTQSGVMPHRDWGQEPGTEPTAMDRDPGGAQDTSDHPASSTTSVTIPFLKLEAEEEEEDKKNIPALDNVPCGATSGESVPAGAQDTSGLQPQEPALDPPSSDPRTAVLETVTQTDPAEDPAELGAAAALVTTSPGSLRARSEAMVCGICMDPLYKKAPKERLFGILPNCSHRYCLVCIRTWRRRRDFDSTVTKGCPECRIISSYYIPHKYWISDANEKEKLIAAFKARTAKIRCKFFVRGHCPFRSECIYLHELPPHQLRRRRRRRRRQRPRMANVFIASPLESSDEEDEELEITRGHLAMLRSEFPDVSTGCDVLDMILQFCDCA